MPLKNFDHFVAIDWSGAKLPICNPHIAWAECDQQNANMPSLPHDSWSRTEVFDAILKAADSGKRYLIGIDCNFSYCETIVKKLCGEGAKAADLWALIDDVCSDTPNFLASDFWNISPYKDLFWTQGARPGWFDTKNLQRAVEKICAEKNLGNPESPFKLIGAKQVGKGGLSGMRLCHQLKIKLGHRVAFFPFDDEERLNQASVILTEIYPRLFWMMAGFGRDKITKIELIKKALDYFATKSSKTLQDDLSNDQSDALIAAAGLRFLCGKGAFMPEKYTNFDDLSRHRTRIEGWIFGV